MLRWGLAILASGVALGFVVFSKRWNRFVWSAAGNAAGPSRHGRCGARWRTAHIDRVDPVGYPPIPESRRRLSNASDHTPVTKGALPLISHRLIAALVLFIAPVSAIARERQPVPDATAAVALAEKRLIPIYGKKQIESERPFTAKLESGVWHVCGYLPPEADGGVAEIWINMRTGKVLKVRHCK